MTWPAEPFYFEVTPGASGWFPPVVIEIHAPDRRAAIRMLCLLAEGIALRASRSDS